MPMPTPGPDEAQNDFMSRCMGDSTMQNDYPDEKQRTAVCLNQLRRNG